MTISTIKSLVADGSFESQHGTLWCFNVFFTDGVSGRVNTKSALAPYKPGDCVGYEITGQDKRGTNKLKIDRKAAQNAEVSQTPAQAATQAPLQANTANSPATPSIHPATAGCAFKEAVACLQNDFSFEGKQDGSFAKAVWELSSQFVRVLYKLETGKLAPKIGVVPEAAKEALKETGFTPPAPVKQAPEDTEDVPF